MFGFFFIGFLRTHHTAYQAYGILQNYNYKNRLRSSLKEFLKSEKRIFNIFFIFCLANPFIFFARPFFKNTHHYFQALGVSALLSCSLAVLIIFRSIKTHGPASNRTLYSLRLLLIPLKYTFLSSAFSSAACHGVEYFWLTRNIEKNCQTRKLEITPLARGLILYILIGFLSFMLWDYLNSTPQYRAYYYAIPVIIFTAFFQIVSIVHFFLDRQFFKFKDPITLKEIGPLLELQKNVPD